MAQPAIRKQRIGKCLTALGVLVLLGTPFVPSLADAFRERWKSFAMPERAQLLLGGQLRYSDWGSLLAVYVAGESGRIWRCDIETLNCNQPGTGFADHQDYVDKSFSTSQATMSMLRSATDCD